MKSAFIVFRSLIFPLFLLSGYSKADICRNNNETINMEKINKDTWIEIPLNGSCQEGAWDFADYSRIHNVRVNPEFEKLGINIEVKLLDGSYVNARTYNFSSYKILYNAYYQYLTPFVSMRVIATGLRTTPSITIPAGNWFTYESEHCYSNGLCENPRTNFTVRFDRSIWVEGTARPTPTCNINSKNTAVKLPEVKKSTFSNIGVVGPSSEFMLGYSCNTQVTASVQLDGNADVTAGKTVLATQAGTGYANGLGIQFLDKSGGIIELGKAYPFSVSSSTMRRTFSARYYQTKSAVTPGLVKGAATVTISIQ